MKCYVKYLKIFGNFVLYLGVFIISLRLYTPVRKFVLSIFNNEILELLLDKWRIGIIIFFVLPVIVYLIIFKFRKENFYRILPVQENIIKKQYNNNNFSFFRCGFYITYDKYFICIRKCSPV